MDTIKMQFISLRAKVLGKTEKYTICENVIPHRVMGVTVL
jgi:hypothetical protein